MRRRSTNLIHPQKGQSEVADPLTTPVYETTTFVFENAREVVDYNEGVSPKYLYSRNGNPTVATVERTLAALDDAEAALVCSSGMAAISTVFMAHLEAGDEVVCSAAIYGGTLHFLSDVLRRFGVEARFVPLKQLAEPESLISDRTRMVWFESPTNPTLRCVRIRPIAEACRSRGVLSVVDNTFATPINQMPLALGVDLVVQSATKYLNGHSDVTGGCVAGAKLLIDRVADARRLLGTVLDPRAAYSLGRALKTLPLRIARHNENAQAVAEFLDQDPRVREVFYPGLSSHCDHEVAVGQMAGFGGMVCFDVGSLDRAEQVYDRLVLIKRAASLGGVESLVSLPILTSQWGHTDDQLRAAGVTRGMLRLSVGLEDANDVIEDLDQALGR